MIVLYLVTGGLILWGLVMLFKNSNGLSRTERFSNEFKSSYPHTLSILPTDAVNTDLVNKLNEALNFDFMESVNTEFRVQFPRYSQNKVNDYWRELKRYLIFASIFQRVDMFNSKVDELWHIMLKHEAEYDNFCNQFIGSKILHIPISQPTFKPSERTFFDFCYVQLFTVDSITVKVWGKLFKHGKGQEFLEEFETESISTLKEKYMRQPTSSLAVSTFELFISRFKEDNTGRINRWHEAYKKNNDVSFGYFVYVDSDDHDNSLRHVFGNDHSSSNSGHGNEGSHSDTSSSCSSCSSCSSS
ncbi:hypothetical protein [Bacillus sp. V5-8f]|uniref:hypothetical protein n=1 Tax=Bacillus sp. V5-8f TaxID=2053044 RepID=UPI000C77776B|nr:hypothetical protein [Bacillus sp. V5-8f]PLT35464.1 hypothetical protein CUU64_02300 [Bacillus sp. V5-8f]